jgi:hypothetical protein
VAGRPISAVVAIGGMAGAFLDQGSVAVQVQGPALRAVDMVIGEAADTFGGAKGEANARAFDVHGYVFMATRPVGHGRRCAEADHMLPRIVNT